MAKKTITMYYAWDKEGTMHSFHHAVDFRTVIQEKGFSPYPPTAPLPPTAPSKPTGEQIEGIETPEEKKMAEKVAAAEKNPKVIIGEVKGKSKAKIER